MSKNLEIELQPLQSEVYYEIKEGTSSVIGLGGGRGSAKSSAIDRIAITLMLERKIMVCMVMRNYNQIKNFHIDVIGRDFPSLQDNIKETMPAFLKVGDSRCDFSYGENLDDIERRFRSGNYDYIFVDQAEQFYEDELREIGKACRSTSGRHLAKMILAFNMRGSSIQELRKWFQTKELNPEEDPNDYKFFKFDPWSNVHWVEAALERDGYSVDDYYDWTDSQRKEYAAKKGQYTKKLATDDEVIRQADWEGSWDSIEGTFYANSWDLQSTRITDNQVQMLRKDWATHWISQDWARSHYAVTYWHYKVTISPNDIQTILGWSIQKPINVIVTYRELIVNEKESIEVAQYIADSTPIAERPKIRSFFLSQDAFGEKDSTNTVATQEGKILRANDMPYPARADNELVGGWGLMGKLLKSTKGHGFIRDLSDNFIQADDVWFISCECPELLKSIPMLMRDPKNIEIVLKTDKSKARVEMDCADACRYGLKSMLAPRKKTETDIFNEDMAKASPAQRMLLTYRREAKKQAAKKKTFKLPPSWKKPGL